MQNLALLDDGLHYTYQARQASLSQYTQATFGGGLGEVDQDDLFVLFDIFIEGVKIGRIHQTDDGTWTASPAGSTQTSQHRHRRVLGFAHELYAAAYLEECALEKGLLDGTTRVVDYNL